MWSWATSFLAVAALTWAALVVFGLIGLGLALLWRRWRDRDEAAPSSWGPRSGNPGSISSRPLRRSVVDAAHRLH